jgi:selenoprotein W-related protein
VPRPRLEITYCTQCRWLLRAGWTAQELLTTFPADLGEVALVPGTGGVFTVRLDDDVLWDAAVRRGPNARRKVPRKPPCLAVAAGTSRAASPS